MNQYYFDHAASAPRRDAVTEAMARWQHGVVGNPSGSHRAAREARRAVEEAREESLVSSGPSPVASSSPAGVPSRASSRSWASRIAYRRSHERCELIVSKIEHHAVLDAAEMMARDYDDVSVRYVDVDAEGVVDLDSLREVMSEDTALVSVMAVNNETGVRQPLDGVTAVVRSCPARR